MTSEKLRSIWAYRLFSTVRLVNEDNVAILNDTLLRSLLYFTSDTRYAKNACKHVEYGLISTTGYFKGVLGFKLRNKDIRLTEILKRMLDVDFTKVKTPYYFSDELTPYDWIAAIECTFQVLSAFERFQFPNEQPVSYGTSYRLGYGHDVFTYDLFTAPLLVNNQTLEFIAKDLIDAFQIFAKDNPNGNSNLASIEYGVVEYLGVGASTTYGLKLKGKSVNVGDVILGIVPNWRSPAAVKKIFPDLTSNEILATIEVASAVVRGFERIEHPTETDEEYE